jgi:hypothetical protein
VERVDDLDAEHWISWWKREARSEKRPVDRRTAPFWDEGGACIAENRRRR